MGNSNTLLITSLLTSCPWGTPTQEQWNEFWALGDVNRDGYIDQTDVDLIGAQIGWTGTPGSIPEDINSDGVVDIGDVSIVSLNMGWDICSYFGRRPTTLTATAPINVVPNTLFEVSAHLEAADTLTPIANAELILYKKVVGVDAIFHEVARGNTDSNGNLTMSETLATAQTAEYLYYSYGDAEFEGC